MSVRTIWMTTRFVGFHAWPDAPDEVRFLRDRHRHEFHVRVEVPVDHADRAIEFTLAKGEVVRFISEQWPAGELGAMSCEMIAEAICDFMLRRYGCAWVKADVSEDGENGGTCTVLADPALLANILGDAT